MRSLTFAALFLVFAALRASPIGDDPLRPLIRAMPVRKEDELAYDSPRKRVAMGNTGGVVETTLEGHRCQILKINQDRFELRNTFTEYRRLRVEEAGSFSKETADNWKHSKPKTLEDYLILKEDFFSSEPPGGVPQEKLKQLWEEAGKAYGESMWSTFIRRTDPKSFVYHRDSMAVYIGPPTPRDKSIELKIDEASFNHILNSAVATILRGTLGKLMKVVLNQQIGQILIVEAGPGLDQRLVKRLHQSDQVEGYKKVGNSYYFFLLAQYFISDIPKVTRKELQQMRKDALNERGIKHTIKGADGFLYNPGLGIVIYIGKEYSARLVSHGSSHTLYYV